MKPAGLSKEVWEGLSKSNQALMSNFDADVAAAQRARLYAIPSTRIPMRPSTPVARRPMPSFATIPPPPRPSTPMAPSRQVSQMPVDSTLIAFGRWVVQNDYQYFERWQRSQQSAGKETISLEIQDQTGWEKMTGVQKQDIITALSKLGNVVLGFDPNATIYVAGILNSTTRFKESMATDDTTSTLGRIKQNWKLSNARQKFAIILTNIDEIDPRVLVSDYIKPAFEAHAMAQPDQIFVLYRELFREGNAAHNEKVLKQLAAGKATYRAQRVKRRPKTIQRRRRPTTTRRKRPLGRRTHT